MNKRASERENRSEEHERCQLYGATELNEKCEQTSKQTNEYPQRGFERGFKKGGKHGYSELNFPRSNFKTGSYGVDTLMNVEGCRDTALP